MKQSNKQQFSQQSGNLALNITLGVLVLGIIMGALAFVMLNQKKPAAIPAVQGPSSPYEALSAGQTDRDLQYDQLNLQSGLKQEELNIKNLDGAINDKPQTISDEQ